MPRPKKNFPSPPLRVVPTPPRRQPTVDPNETPHDKFKRLANRRVKKIIVGLRELGRLGAGGYTSLPEEIDRLETTITDEILDCFAKLRRQKTPRAPVEDIL